MYLQGLSICSYKTFMPCANSDLTHSTHCRYCSADLHVGYRQPRADQCERKVWDSGSRLLNPLIWPWRHPIRAEHGRVSSPCRGSHHCCFAGGRDHHGCQADIIHWCYFHFRYFFSLHGGKKQIQGPLHLVRNGCLFRQPNEVITEKLCPHTPFNTHLPETIMEWNDPSPSAAVWYNQECFCLHFHLFEPYKSQTVLITVI